MSIQESEINTIKLVDADIDSTTVEVDVDAIPPPPTPEPVKRSRGRPKGSVKKTSSTDASEPEPVKRGRGRPKGTFKTENIKTGPDYFKKYYIDKTKPKLESAEKVKCIYCHTELFPDKLKRHQKTAKFCNIIQKCQNQLAHLT
jgi:hypothetical protein